MASGIEEISYIINPKSFDEYKLYINGRYITIPVVGAINPEGEVRLCQVLQSIIDKEKDIPYGG